MTEQERAHFQDVAKRCRASGNQHPTRFVADRLRRATLLDAAAAIATLLERVEQLQQTLEDRKVIERAKGLLMDAHQLTEGEAFAMIRSRSQATNQKMADVARAVITTHELVQNYKEA